jgi:C-terminal processing protease CtpA/Prc
MAAHQPSESSLTRERFESVDDSAKDSSDLSKLGLGKMSESFFSDDASFEEQFVDQDERFEVLAPAGKLGMVIDTPSGGVPVVHAIKDNSVLSDAVRVGDRLISVDGEDCSAMTAMQVSKLISLKANNSTRTLVFIRRGTDGTALAHDE